MNFSIMSIGPRIQTAGMYLTIPGGGGDMIVPDRAPRVAAASGGLAWERSDGVAMRRAVRPGYSDWPDFFL